MEREQVERAPRRHLAAGAALSVVAQVAPLASGAALSIVLARTLGPSGNGHYALLGTVLGLTTLIFSVGLPAGLTNDVSRGRCDPRRAVRSSFVPGAVLGAAAGLAAFGLYLLTRHSVFRGVSLGVAIIAFASAPAFVQYQLSSGIALGADAYEVYSGLEVVHAMAILFVGASLALAFGLEGAVIGLAASGFASAAVGWLLLRRRRTAASAAVAAAPYRVAGAARFGVQTWVPMLLQQVNYRLDLIILGAFAASSKVGTYSVAVTIAGLAWVLPQALQTVVFPRAANLDAAAQGGETTTAESDVAIARVCRHTVMLLPVAALGVAALLAVAVPLLYGSKFHQSILLGLILLPGITVLGLGKVMMSIVIGRGFPKYALYSGLITVPFTLALYFTLIPALHAWGAAVGSTVSYTLTFLTIVYAFRRVTHIPLSDALWPTRTDLKDYGQALDALRAWIAQRRGLRHYAG